MGFLPVHLSRQGVMDICNLEFRIRPLNFIDRCHQEVKEAAYKGLVRPVLTGSAVTTHDVTTGTGYCLVGFNWIIDFLN